MSKTKSVFKLLGAAVLYAAVAIALLGVLLTIFFAEAAMLVNFLIGFATGVTVVLLFAGASYALGLAFTSLFLAGRVLFSRKKKETVDA